MATGNHFWLDCLAGSALALISMGVVYKWDAIRGVAVRARRGAQPGPHGLTRCYGHRRGQGRGDQGRLHVRRARAGDPSRSGSRPDARHPERADRERRHAVRDRRDPRALEHRNEMLFYWVGAAVFVAGSVLDILDGALARAGGKSTPFGAFLDSTTDRVSEGFMLAAIAYVFAYENKTLRRRRGGCGRRLVPRLLHAGPGRGARAEGRRRDRLTRRTRRRDHRRPRPRAVGRPAVGDRAAAATAWITVCQRVLSVRKQLESR